jgi:hypothetical protein
MIAFSDKNMVQLKVANVITSRQTKSDHINGMLQQTMQCSAIIFYLNYQKKIDPFKRIINEPVINFTVFSDLKISVSQSKLLHVLFLTYRQTVFEN